MIQVKDLNMFIKKQENKHNYLVVRWIWLPPKQPKNLDQFYKLGQEFWNSFGGEKHVIVELIWHI